MKFQKIIKFIREEMFCSYFIMDAYDMFDNKVNHKIAHSYFEKEITLFLWLNKYCYVTVIWQKWGDNNAWFISIVSKLPQRNVWRKWVIRQNNVPMNYSMGSFPSKKTIITKDTFIGACSSQNKLWLMSMLMVAYRLWKRYSQIPK